ncbi:MAG: hypothetical protein ACKV2Q_00830 [Planctomycetaceae bacterium]
MNRKFSGMLVVLLACGVYGCGNEHGTPVVVTGKVTLGGMPVEKARIIFHASDNKLPAELRTVMAELKPDGSYSLDKVYLTEYAVMFESTVAADATKSAIPVPSPLTPYGPGSKLRAKVTADKTKFDFELPANPPPK